MKVKRLRIQSQGKISYPQLESSPGNTSARYGPAKRYQQFVISEGPFPSERSYSTQVELYTDEKGELTDSEGRLIVLLLSNNGLDLTKIIRELRLCYKEKCCTLNVVYEGEKDPVSLGWPVTIEPSFLIDDLRPLDENIYNTLKYMISEHVFHPVLFDTRVLRAASNGNLKLYNALQRWTKAQLNNPISPLDSFYPEAIEGEIESKMTPIDLVANGICDNLDPCAMQAIEFKLKKYALLPLIFQGSRQADSNLSVLNNHPELICLIAESILGNIVKTEEGEKFLKKTVYHFLKNASASDYSALCYLYNGLTSPKSTESSVESTPSMDKAKASVLRNT